MMDDASAASPTPPPPPTDAAVPSSRASGRTERYATGFAVALLVALGPLVALAPRGLPIWFVLLAVTAIVASWRDGFPRPSIDPIAAAPVLALIAWALISAFWSPSPRAFATTAEIAYAGIGTLVIAAWFRDLDAATRRRLRIAAAAGVSLGLALFVVETWRDYPIHRWWNQVPSDEPVYGTNVPKRTGVLLSALSWSLAMFALTGGGRWVAMAVPALVTTILAFSSSRSAMFGMIAGIGVFLVAHIDAARAAGTRRWLRGLTVAGLIVMVPLAWPLAELASVAPIDGFFRSALHRFEIWGHAVGRIVEAPLSGYGIDAARALPVAGETSRFGPLGPTVMPLHPHNAFLQVWLELGAMGAAVMAALVLVVFARRRMPNATSQPLILGMYACALAMVAEAYGVWQAWWMCGLLTGGLLLALQADQQEKPPS